MLEGDRVTSASSTFLSAALVLAHTFAAQILVTAALPLLLFVPLHRFSKGPVGQSKLLLLLIQSETCSQALGVAFDRLFRRHLIAHFSLVWDLQSLCLVNVILLLPLTLSPQVDD